MKFISHRGNVTGPNPNKENHPDYIDAAINLGFKVEVDLRVVEGKYFLGHDEPQYEVTIGWLVARRDLLYVHIKDMKSFEHMLEGPGGPIDLHMFFHDNDECTITSEGNVWVHPRAKQIKGGIAVMPEVANLEMESLMMCYGVCTDHVLQYQKDYNKIEVLHDKRQKNRRSSIPYQ